MDNEECCDSAKQAECHTMAIKGITDCVKMESDEDTRESVNDGVEVNLAKPREPEEDMITHKMTRCKKVLA